MTGARLVDSIHARSLRDPEGFWGEAATSIRWTKPWEVVLDRTVPPYDRWFRGGRMSTSYECLDRHVDEGRGDALALVYESPLASRCERYSFRELRDAVANFAGAIANQGVGKGDRVLIYMPMVPEAVIAMLACARLGAIHSVVFGGFAASELATRIDDATPKLIVAASCGVEPGRVVPYKPMLDEAIRLSSNPPSRCIVLQREQLEASLVPDRDIAWTDAVASATPHDNVEVEATDPLYILYTSGTTGQPKGVVRDHGGHLVALRWSMTNVYGARPGDVFWAASDVGWVVGHSYIVYGPLAHGCTTILYEGKPVGTPDAGAFWRVIEKHRVNVFFTAPTAFRAIRKEDPEGAFVAASDLSSLRALFLAGERSDPATVAWAQEKLRVPVVDHWWQTETGWPIVANCLGIEELPIKLGSPTLPVPGWDVRVVDDGCRELPNGTTGSLVVKLPLPPGALPTLWNADQRFVDAYLTEFPGFYKTADAGVIDEDGYVHVLARTDDIINVAGHRLSTGQMEEVLASHADVAECAVVGVADAMKGQLPFGFVVLKSGAAREEADLVRELVALVRDRIGPVAAFKQAVVVRRLPKTRSGKILRGTMQKIADCAPHKVPATIDDEAVLDEIRAALVRVGYARG